MQPVQLFTHACGHRIASLAVCVAVCSAMLAMAGCASTPAPARVDSVSSERLAAPQPGADLLAALRVAHGRVVEARARLGAQAAGADLLARAEFALRSGRLLTARRLADAARMQATAALDTHFLDLAERELRQARQHTHLGATQRADLRRADTLIARGEGRQAYDIAAHINQSARIAKLVYDVVAGDTLWGIAARPEIYDNGFLWPLIFNANRNQLVSPSALMVGMDLVIPRNPTVDETYEALGTSGGLGNRARVDVGTVRTQ